MAKTQELDLYATPGWRESFDLEAIGWKGFAGLALALLLLGGVATYGWMKKSEPVSVDRALAEFRKSSSGSAQRKQSAGRAPKRAKAASRNKGSKNRPAGRRAGGGETSKMAVAAPASDQPAQPGSEDRQAAPAPRQESQYERTSPREGVYTWETEGWESAAGTRRELPEETQRIITLQSNGWQTHHYFSDKRENWTWFEVLEDGAAIAKQRNKVTFGPVTNDSTIDFAPPMLVGPRRLEVGQKWSGRWSGKTSGVYTGETFEKVEINIGGEMVETYGIRVHSEMTGEIEGTVDARVWLSTKYVLTVKEHYKQDVKADVGRYQSEWNMTLQSVEPRR